MEPEDTEQTDPFEQNEDEEEDLEPLFDDKPADDGFFEALVFLDL